MRNPSSSTSAAAVTGKNNGTTTTKTTPCCSKVGLKRGPWTPEEDELLANYIKKEGEGRWRTLPKRAGLLRCGKSCRLRWMNYLRPSVKRGQIAPDEEDLILRLHRLLGNRWSLIAGRIPGRTDNEIKNYWNTHLSKKLISQGIDPRTHKPLNPDHHLLSTDAKAFSSSKPNLLPSPNNNNPHPSSSAINDIINTNSRMTANENNKIRHLRNTNLDDDQYGEDGIGDVNLQNSDSSAMGLRGSHNNEEEDDINYCGDDVFSSFLNSLINEDVFANQHQLHLQVHHPNGIIAPPAASDALISSAPTNFGFGTGWEAALLSSTTSGFNQNDQKRFNDHAEKQF